MQTDFRQGIITYPNSRGTQTFLIPSGRFISQQTSINDRLDLTFAHGETDYLITENIAVPNAWGPFSADTDYWLYWDIDKFTSIRTFGITTLEPIISTSAPSGVTGQHWFDTTNNKMFVYQSAGWREVIRLFAAKVNNNKFTPLGTSSYIGSQVGLTSSSTAGRIILDELGVPIIQTNGSFLTTEDELYVDSAPINVIKLDANVVDVTARENIAKFQVVKFTEFGVVNLAVYNDLQSNLIGLTLSDMLLRQTGKVCLTGVITNPAWNYSNIGGFLWVTDAGLLTETNLHKADPANHDVSKLPVGQILSPTTILFGQGFGDVGAAGVAHPEIPLATETVIGLASLSVPADNAADPIMVETNDPRLVPYVHPATHPASIITTNVYNFLTGLETQTQLQELANRSLDSLSDVSASSPSVGNALTWNGTAWAPAVVSAAQYLANLTDVSLLSPVSGQQLVYNGVVWTNITPTINLTGDLTGTGTTSISTTLATVNSNVGTFGDSTHVAQFTVNAKGLVTGVTSVPITFSGGGGGGLTSFDITSDVPNLTFTGGPITTTGTITLSGTLEIASGGTSATTANDAFNNLAPDQGGPQYVGTTLWSWGDNTNGTLGNGTSGVGTHLSSPQQIGALTTWSQISCSYHSMAIKTDGSLWTWGLNTYGELGTGTITNTSSPVQVGLLTDWTSITCGTFHTLAIKTNGTSWVWGDNYTGQLGLGDLVHRSSPIQIGALTTWEKVAGGEFFSLAKQTDGTLWSWGNNASGQLGIGTIIDVSSPTQIGVLTTWSQIATGDAHCAVLKTDGTMWSWGANDVGQLGNILVGPGTNLSSPQFVNAVVTWSAVSCGYKTTAGIRTDGTLWMCGLNSFGQLGRGDIIHRSSFVQVGSLQDWVEISCGRRQTVGRRADGTIWAWGYNGNGELGIGDLIHRSSPVQIGSYSGWTQLATNGTWSTLLALRGEINTPSQANEWLSTDSQNTSWEPVNLVALTPMYMWGYNFTTGTSVPKTSPIEILSGTNWAHIGGGDQHVLGIKADGTLWGWWGNFNGSLGDGSITFRSFPVQIGNDNTWRQVEGAFRHTVAVKTDGTLWTWGRNTAGQLGLGDVVHRSSPTQVGSLTTWDSVSCTWDYTMAIRTDGTLWAWGDNDAAGILGVGDAINRSSPTQVGSDTNWSQVSCGGIIASAIKTDGTLWGWGTGNQGHIGDGVLSNRSSPVQVGSDTDWVQVHTINSGATAAIKRNGTLWTWGDNAFGQLGVGSSNSLLLFSTPVQLGALSDWKQIGGGERYKIALKTDGTIWGWGQNFNGQLANGTFNGEHISSPVQIGSLYNWLSVANMATGSMTGAIRFIDPTIIYPITSGGTGVTSAREAINALLPSQVGNAGKVLSTDGTNLIWVPKASILP